MNDAVPRIPFLLTVLVSALIGSLVAQEPRAMTIVDLIEVPGLSDPRLSPDGRYLLYVRSDADWEANRTISHIWRIRTDGSGETQLTYGDDGERSPRWSPDGGRIAFLASRGDEDATQIYLLNVMGGEANALTSHPTDVGSIQWAPDGRHLYFSAADERSPEEKARIEAKDDVYAFDENYRHDHVWRIGVEGGDAVRITEGDFTVTDFTLSRDGSHIAYHRGPSPLLEAVASREVWVMASDGSEPRRVTENGVPESGAELSPDNRTVLFTADSNGDFDFYYNDKIFLAPASGGGPYRVVLPDLPYSVSTATWSGDGSSIYFRANTGVREELFVVGADGSGLRQLTRGDHRVTGWHYLPGRDLHAFGVTDRENAGDLWVGSNGDFRKVTRVFDHLAREFRLPRQEAIRWTGEDGVTVEGLLFYPLDYSEGRSYPLVVQTHGGPASSDQFGFGSSSDYVQVLAARGYMVLQPNYRGSTGYGDAFLRDMVGHYFNQAHKDVMAGVDHLISLGLVDGSRMAKMGWSAGGHMTNKIITHTDRFRAAASGAGAANWISMYAQSDVRVYRTPWFGGTPWEEGAPIDQYWQDSPLREVWKVKTPTIFLVGEEDPRVPMPQSVEMYRALKRNGVDTHLYVAPRQGHGWRELRHRLFKANVELGWFERWVMERDYEWEEAPGEDGKPARSTNP